MKKIEKKDLKSQCVCSKRHKFLGAFALIGLFVCGLFVGITYNYDRSDASRQGLGVEECDAVAQEIVNITTAGATAENVEILRELNEAYSNGCAGRLVVIDRTNVAEEKNEHPEIIATCSRIEMLLKERLYPETEKEAWKHLENAFNYSTMAEKGCAENADMYKSLALREIEIATALQPEENMGQESVEIVIDTYKKLDMKREAQAFLDKMEKLTDPAIDFILQMQKIINE